MDISPLLLISLIFILIIFCITVVALFGMVMGNREIGRDAVGALTQLGQGLIEVLKNKPPLFDESVSDSIEPTER